MDDFLVVRRVSLVGEIDDDGVVISHEEWFPDICVRGSRWSAVAGCDVGDERPGLATVVAGIEVELGTGDIWRDGVPCAEDRAGRKGTDGYGEFVQEGLVPQTPAVDCVVYLADLRPGLSGVGAAVDGEVDVGHVWAVVFPCCEDGAAGEEGGTGVECSWLRVVGGRCEDGDRGNVTGFQGFECWGSET